VLKPPLGTLLRDPNRVNPRSDVKVNEGRGQGAQGEPKGTREG
jgi:hypothetical protein